MVERIVYGPYGRPTFYTAAWAKTQFQGHADGTVSLYGADVLFAGYRYDFMTGLYSVRRRVYHPTLGRWLQRDPLGYVDGMGLYEYCGGGPGVATDPCGDRLAEPEKERDRIKRFLSRDPLGRLILFLLDALDYTVWFMDEPWIYTEERNGETRQRAARGFHRWSSKEIGIVIGDNPTLTPADIMWIAGILIHEGTHAWRYSEDQGEIGLPTWDMELEAWMVREIWAFRLRPADSIPPAADDPKHPFRKRSNGEEWLDPAEVAGHVSVISGSPDEVWKLVPSKPPFEKWTPMEGWGLEGAPWGMRRPSDLYVPPGRNIRGDPVLPLPIGPTTELPCPASEPRWQELPLPYFTPGCIVEVPA